MFKSKLLVCAVFSLVCSGSILSGQTPTTATDTQPPFKKTARAQRRARVPHAVKPATRQFVLDVVKSALGLSADNSEDRLRVLYSAVQILRVVDPVLAKKYAHEGIQIESQLIAQGELPPVSMLSSGAVACADVATFVEDLSPDAIQKAEQSMIGAVSVCPKGTLEAARMKLDAALEDHILAPRAEMAVMQAAGKKSAWSESEFDKFFSSLPKGATSASADVPDYGTLYATMAPEVDKDVAQKAGLNLLVWLNGLNPGPEKNLAVNATTSAMQSVFGEKKYKDILASDVIAQQVAKTAGGAGQVQLPEEENVSIVNAMRHTGEDQSSELASLAPSLRAREAAAHGYASAHAGDRSAADRYLDMAYSALNEVWASRTPAKDAAAVVEEVNQAAANVDAVSALTRAQQLQDPSAQAIGMLAVAQVMLEHNH